jgi:hypothetical protein
MSISLLVRRNLVGSRLGNSFSRYYPRKLYSSHAPTPRKNVAEIITSQHGNISTEDYKKYRFLFKLFDKEGKGVKVCDFVEVVRESGLTATEEEIENLFERMNLQSYGVMNEKEFVSFISNIKTTSYTKLDVQPHITKEGSEMTWWAKKVAAAKYELAHYKRGFSLLYSRLKFAVDRSMNIFEGRSLSRYESRKVINAARDFLILIPVAAMAMLPGGSVVVAFLVKYFPQCLPSTFRVENMSRERKHELVLTEVTAVIEEMELKLSREKVEWTKSDVTYARLLEHLANSTGNSMSLDIFLHNSELNIDINTNLKTKGIIARLDDFWLQLLCQASMSTSGSGSFDPRSIKKSPLPILRSLLRRRMEQIAKNNNSINGNKEKLATELTQLEDPKTLPMVLTTRCFPSTLTPIECQVWMQLENSSQVLLSFMYQLHNEYLAQSATQPKAN